MTIPFRYDAQVDAGYIKLSDAEVERTIDLEPTALGLPVLIDVDASGALVGIEILKVTTTAPSLV